MIIGQSATIARRTGRARLAFRALHARRARQFTPQAVRCSRGFTILEIIIVLFLLVGLLGIILPRFSLDDSLGTVGRRLVGTVRSLQSLAMLTQKTIRLYVDIDRGVYWPMILDGGLFNH